MVFSRMTRNEHHRRPYRIDISTLWSLLAAWGLLWCTSAVVWAEEFEAAVGTVGRPAVAGPQDLEPAAPAVLPEANAPPKGFLPIPADQFQPTRAGGPAVVTDPAGGLPLVTPELTTSFEGINGRNANTGYPADCHIAVGPNHILQAVNQTFRVYDRSGNQLRNQSFASFFSTVQPSGTRSPFDPWVTYDHFADRFAMVLLTYLTPNQNDAWFLFAVSQGPDPTGSWWVWALRSDTFGSEDQNLWADYEKLEYNDTNFYITCNQFQFNPTTGGSSFQHSRIIAFPKAPAYAGSGFTFSIWRRVKHADGNNAFTIQPCKTLESTSAKEYLVSTYSGSGSIVTVFSITGTTGTFNLTREGTVNIASYTATGTNAARQLGASTGVETGDTRLLNAAYRDNRIYTCFPEADTVENVRIRAVVIDAITKAALFDGAFRGSGADYYWPAITPFGSPGDFLVVWSFSGPSNYIGGRYTTNESGTWQASRLLKSGEASYVRVFSGRNRWGDYNGIGLDPGTTGIFWVATQFAESAGSNEWGTWIGSNAVSITCPLEAALEPRRLLRSLSSFDLFASLKHHSKEQILETVRSFRDTTLGRSRQGRALADAYYRHGAEIQRLLADDPQLLAETLSLIVRLLPVLSAEPKGAAAVLTVDRATYDRGRKLIGRFEDSASPALKRSLAELRRFLAHRSHAGGDFVAVGFAESATSVQARLSLQSQPREGGFGGSATVALSALLSLGAVMPVLRRKHR